MSSEVRVSQIDDSTGIGRVGKKKRGKEKNNVKKTQGVLSRMGKKAGQIKAGQTLGQTNVQTPLLPLSGTRKVVRTPTNPFEAAGTVEVFVPKEIIARRIQAIFAGPNKGRKAEHYLVVWEDYPLKKDYTWEPIENLYGHEDVQLSRAEQVSVSLLPRVELTLKLCTTSDCCRVLCRIVSPAQTVPSGGKSPQTSEADKTRLEMQDWLQMPAIQTSAVIGKNTDGSDITQDVDVLVWWRDVGQARFPRIAVMARQFLAIPAASATAERVFSFAGLTLSDLRKSLFEGTLEAIMWTKWGSPSIPLGRGDLHITHPELCD